MKHEEAGKRLKNVEGHLRGIQRMLDEGVYLYRCISTRYRLFRPL